MSLDSKLRKVKVGAAALAVAVAMSCGGGGDGCGPTDPACNPDRIAPSVSLVSPGDTVGGVVNLGASASDNVGVVGVKFLEDGTQIGSEDLAAPYNVSWNTTSVADGQHILTAVARDAAGNTGTSSPVSVVVDNLGQPIAQLRAYANPSTLTRGQQTRLGAKLFGSQNQAIYDSIRVQLRGLNQVFHGDTLDVAYAPDSTGTATFTGYFSNRKGKGTTTDTKAVTVNNPPPPTAQLRTHLNPDSVLTGGQTTAGAKLYNVQNGKADSIEVVINGQRYVAPGDSLAKIVVPTASGPVNFKGYISAADGSQPQTVTGTENLTMLRNFKVQLVDMDGNPLTQSRTMLIDGVPYATDASGVVSAAVADGTRRIGYARTGANDTTATRLELPSSYQNPVRIIFPRFKINQTATPGEDTVTVNANVNARGVVAGVGANFNKEHYEGYFDDPVYGQQGPRGNTVRFHILKQPNAQFPLCQTMSAAAIATWEQYQTNQLTELQGYYNVTNTEADTLPTTLTSGEYTLLCQGPIVGQEVYRESNGANRIDVAYIFTNSPIAAANTEADVKPYGSSGIEGRCTVPSVFNDDNPIDPTCALKSATPTVYDRSEGLIMMKNFAIPANVRAINTNTFLNGNVKIFFSLRH
jgi:Bacterial Ig domain